MQQGAPQIDRNWINECQLSFTHHARVITRLRETFADDPEACLDQLKPFMRRIFVVDKKSEFASRLQNFFASLALYPPANEAMEEWCDTFLWALVRFCLSLVHVKCKAVRARSCELIGMLINEMPEDQEIRNDDWDSIKDKLVPLLKDKVAGVRCKAISALSRLQDPGEKEDEVTTHIVDLMVHDTRSEVRQEALKTVGIAMGTLEYILTRVRDTSPAVRAETFQILRNKMDLPSFSIFQRNAVLKCGLQDRDPNVRNAASDCLIKAWLDRREGDVIKFLKWFDVENNEESVEIILEEIISKREHLKTAQPPFLEGSLTCEQAIFWRVICDSHYKKRKQYGVMAKLEDLLPDTTAFCEFLKNNHSNEFVARQLLKLAKYLNFSDSFGRGEMLKLARELMKSLPNKTDDDYNGDDLVPLIMRIMRVIYRDEKEYIATMMELISDIRDPIEASQAQIDPQQYVEMENELTTIEAELQKLEGDLSEHKKNDDFEKCSSIQKEMLSKGARRDELQIRLTEREELDVYVWKRVLAIVIDILTYATGAHIVSLDMLIKTTIIPAVDHGNPFIRAPGLKALCLYCLLYKEKAKRFLVVFRHAMANDQEALQLIALQAVFDLISNVPQLLEPEKKKEDGEGENDAEDVQKVEQVEEKYNVVAEPSPKQIIEILIAYLESEDKHLVFAAVQGFTKLMYMNRVHNHKILARLILLYYNPVTKGDDKLRQWLAVFFETFVRVSTTSHLRAIHDAFLLVLRAIAYAPITSPLKEISASTVAEFLLRLLHTPIVKKKNQDGNNIEAGPPMTIIDELGFDVCAEVLAHPKGLGVQTYCTVLNRLDFDPENQHNIKAFRILVDRIIEQVEHGIALVSLHKVKETLEYLDLTPKEDLEVSRLNDLDKETGDRIKSAGEKQKTLLEVKEQEEEKNEIEQAESPKQKKKRKLQKKRKPIFVRTEEDNKASNSESEESKDAPKITNRKRKKPSAKPKPPKRRPVDEESVHEEPVHEESAHEESAHEESAHEESAHEESAHEESVGGDSEGDEPGPVERPTKSKPPKRKPKKNKPTKRKHTSEKSKNEQESSGSSALDTIMQLINSDSDESKSSDDDTSSDSSDVDVPLEEETDGSSAGGDENGGSDEEMKDTAGRDALDEINSLLQSDSDEE